MSSDTKSDFLAGVFRQIEEKDRRIVELEKQLETLGTLDARVEASRLEHFQALEDTIIGLRRTNEAQAAIIAAHEQTIDALRDTIETQRQHVGVEQQIGTALREAIRVSVGRA
jgi:hypothetical protein